MINRKSFIVGVKSTKLSLSEKNFLKKYRPWGVILFSRNINNIDQAKKLTFSIRKIFNGFIGVEINNPTKKIILNIYFKRFPDILINLI